MLNLRLELLTGRYVASRFDDRTRAEWPPHPARVFSALVAAHYQGDPTEAGAAALQWLETLPPPALYFSQLGPDGEGLRDVKTHFVPVNDKALSDAATVNNAWGQLNAAKTEKARHKAETKLSSAYTKAGSALDKASKGAVAQARHVLPETRTKQPRFFPTVVPSDPVVNYAWDIEAPPDQLQALQEIGRYLTRVGHSSSLVSGWWSDQSPEGSHWVADPTGDQVLRWVSPGQFDALEAAHQRAPYGEQRVLPYANVRYLSTRRPAAPARSSFSPRFIILHRERGPRLGVRATERVAEAVRQSLMHHADDPVPSLISGHHGPDDSVRGDHLAIVPLPMVGSNYARGDLLGVALIVPEQADAAELASLHRAVAQWEQTPDGAKTMRAPLKMGSLGVWDLRREVLESRRRNLRVSTWVGPSTLWTTATPMVFDRHPGSLTDAKPSRRRAAHRKAREIVEAAVSRIGLPRPVSVEFSETPWLRGTEPARAFRPGKDNSRTDRRPRMHVRLQFEHPVAGPVLLGAGRFRGLGLFRPVSNPGGTT